MIQAPPEKVMRLRCPNDTDPANYEFHHAVDVRLPVSIDKIAKVAKALAKCSCGTNLVLWGTGEPEPWEPKPTTSSPSSEKTPTP
jgi:hypothetical protein